MARKWGKAGERLDPIERGRRVRAAVAARNHREQRDRADEAIAYRLWREGMLSPYQITLMLDSRGFHGAWVDESCNAEEPEVDLWEAGKLYPRWDQVQALAELCKVQLLFLLQERQRLHWLETSIRFHVPHAEVLAAAAEPPIWRYPADVVAATVQNTPERLGDHP